MNLYYDAEFTGLRQHTSLISLALVSDDGRAFYAEFSDYNRDQLDDWLRDNVLAHCRWLTRDNARPGCHEEEGLTLCFGDSEQIRTALSQWLTQWERVEIWADCPSWDWVLFCELFGGAFNIPDNIYYLPFDLVTLFKARGLSPDTERQQFTGLQPSGAEGQRHNALFDARLLRAAYHRLMEEGSRNDD